MPVKQVIVLRTKFPDGKGGFFKPRLGKMCAQASHASMKVFFDRLLENSDGLCIVGAGGWDWPVVKLWIRGIFTKIVVGCDSEEELLALKDKAEQADIPCALIQDVGTTEFHGVPTYTALAIGPDTAERIDPITKHLVLL